MVAVRFKGVTFIGEQAGVCEPGNDGEYNGVIITIIIIITTITVVLGTAHIPWKELM